MVLAILVVAVLVGTAIGAVSWCSHHEKGRVEILTLYGNIDIRDVQLAFNESQRVTAVMVQEGDVVRAGQIVATVERDRLEAMLAQGLADTEAQEQVVERLVRGTRPQEIAQARAEVEAARTRVRNARRNFDRLRRTVGTGATSRQAVDDARSALEVAEAELNVQRQALTLALEGPRKEEVAAARARLESMRARVELLKIRLGDTILAAPADGIVESRILEPGDMASPGRPVLLLALTDPKWVRAYVPEPDLGRVNLGMTATVESDSFPGERFLGWVGFISPAAEFTPKSVETTDLRTKLVYEVRIYVRDPADRLRLGMPVTVRIDHRSTVDGGLAPSGRMTPPPEGASPVPAAEGAGS